MPKSASGCKIREDLFRGESIICFRSPVSDTLQQAPWLGSSRLERGSSGGLNSSSAVPTPAGSLSLAWFQAVAVLSGLHRTFPHGVRSFPYKDCRILKRVNGPYTLYMTAGGGNRLPYGNLPRLLMAWVSTEAVRTRSRELVLGRSLSEFMRKVGIFDDGGALRRRLRTQMDRPL